MVDAARSRGQPRFVAARADVHQLVALAHAGRTRQICQGLRRQEVGVQIGIEHVNYGNKFTNRSGPPDWVNETVGRTNILDAEDAMKQACAP